MPITAITVHLQWLDTLITLAVPPKTLTMDQAKDQCKEWGEECVLFEKEDTINFDFSLEVSSPGIDRPLIKIDDYRNHLGSYVAVSYTHLTLPTKA